MVVRADQDKAVMAGGTELADASTHTEPTPGHEVGVSVCPDTCDHATDMDLLPMTTSGTSMTPIKIDKKAVRK